VQEIEDPEIATKRSKALCTKEVPENKAAAHKGGKIAGDARGKLEFEIEDKVVSSENYLIEPEARKRFE
jgi:hypothetical protein